MFQPSIFWVHVHFQGGILSLPPHFFEIFELLNSLNFGFLSRCLVSRWLGKTVEKILHRPGMSGLREDSGFFCRGHRCDPIIGMVYDGFLDGNHGTVYFLNEEWIPTINQPFIYGKWHTDIPDPYGSIFASYGQYILGFGDEHSRAITDECFDRMVQLAAGKK